MNDTSSDFESRARAAGRAARHAVDDVPAVTALAPRRSRGPIRALAIAAAVVLVSVAGTAIAVNQRADGPASDVTNFCAQIAASASQPVDTVTNETTGDTSTHRDPHAEDYLRDAPSEIRDVAQALLSDRQNNRPVNRPNSQRLLNWFEIRCYPDAAQAGANAENQRFAPLPAPPGVTICSVTNRFPVGDGGAGTSDTYGTITIFGDSSFQDPYTVPMIGVAESREEVFRDDDTATPIAIPGHPDAVISTMSSAFSNRIDGSQVISWRQDDRNIGVFGRSYGVDRTSRLVAIASAVTMNGNQPVIALNALPIDSHELFRGPLLATSYLNVASDPTATSSLTANRGRVQMNAQVMWEGGSGADEAIRFFAPQVVPQTVAGHSVLAGPVVGSAQRGPGSIELARWSPGPGILMTALGLPNPGSPPVDLRTLIRTTRRLDRSEWETLISQSEGCFGDLVQSRTASGAGSATPPESGPAVTATTSPTPTTSVP